jgi:hypothetical protein
MGCAGTISSTYAAGWREKRGEERVTRVLDRSPLLQRNVLTTARKHTTSKRSSRNQAVHNSNPQQQEAKREVGCFAHFAFRSSSRACVVPLSLSLARARAPTHTRTPARSRRACAPLTPSCVPAWEPVARSGWRKDDRAHSKLCPVVAPSTLAPPFLHTRPGVPMDALDRRRPSERARSQRLACEQMPGARGFALSCFSHTRHALSLSLLFSASTRTTTALTATAHYPKTCPH